MKRAEVDPDEFRFTSAPMAPTAAATAPDVVTSGGRSEKGHGLATGESCTCARCGYGGCDLRIVPCGCTIHARCVPLTILADHANLLPHRIANQSMSLPLKGCPLCGMNPMTGMQLFALSFRDLEESGILRSRCATANIEPLSADVDQQMHSGVVRKRGEAYDSDNSADDLPKKHAAAQPFLGLSHSTAGERSAERDRHHTRTGRWTSEEITYVDHLIRYFEEGLLPVPKGVKLNEFLSDMLMCKSSRLTKKMKNAKLSTRSYSFSDWRGGAGFCCVTLSRLEEHFLKSVQTEPTRLELKFNLTRMWRTHFSNLCLQLGYDSVYSEDWLSSLEEMEQRASDAEEMIRKAQRKRMGLALRRDAETKCLSGVYFGGLDAKEAVHTHSKTFEQDVSSVKPDAPASTSKGLTRTNSMTLLVPRPRSGSISAPIFPSVTDSQQNRQAQNAPYNTKDEVDFLTEIFSAEQSKVGPAVGADGKGMSSSAARPRFQSDDISLAIRERFLSEDFSIGMDIDEPNSEAEKAIDDRDVQDNGGPFLSKIIEHMEQTNVPFHHVDVWVPSFLPSDSYDGTDTCDESKAPNDGQSQELRLCHAGYATRTDLNSPTLTQNLNEFGVYSANFSFASGSGLPGRVYSTGIPTWENAVQHATPEHFKRCGGAKLYGIKTLVGIPVFSPSIGRIVVALYSTLDVPRDVDLVKKLFLEYQTYRPEPKWKLVVDLGDAESNNATGMMGISSDVGCRSGGSIEVTGRDHAPPFAKTDANKKRSSVLSMTSSMSENRKRSSVFSAASSMSEVVTNFVPVKSENDDESFTSSSLGKSFCSTDNDEEEQQMASLLGEHMPSGSQTTDKDLISSCISLRLLLLRDRDRRSPKENELIDIMKKSYRGYSRVNRRSGDEVVALLAKDWAFLSPPKTSEPSVMQSSDTSSAGNKSNPANSLTHVNYSKELSTAHDMSRPTSSQWVPPPAPSQASNSQSSQRMSPVVSGSFPSSSSGQRQTASLSKISDDGSSAAGNRSDNSLNYTGAQRSRAVSAVSDPPTPKPSSSVVSIVQEMS